MVMERKDYESAHRKLEALQKDPSSILGVLPECVQQHFGEEDGAKERAAALRQLLVQYILAHGEEPQQQKPAEKEADEKKATKEDDEEKPKEGGEEDAEEGKKTEAEAEDDKKEEPQQQEEEATATATATAPAAPVIDISDLLPSAPQEREAMLASFAEIGLLTEKEDKEVEQTVIEEVQVEEEEQEQDEDIKDEKKETAEEGEEAKKDDGEKEKEGKKKAKKTRTEKVEKKIKSTVNVATGRLANHTDIDHRAVAVGAALRVILNLDRREASAAPAVDIAATPELQILRQSEPTKTPISVFGKSFVSCEHYLAMQKAHLFQPGDDALMQKIQSAETPEEARGVAKDIPNFCEEKWSEYRSEAAFCAAAAAVSVDKRRYYALLSTGLAPLTCSERGVWGAELNALRCHILTRDYGAVLIGHPHIRHVPTPYGGALTPSRGKHGGRLMQVIDQVLDKATPDNLNRLLFLAHRNDALQTVIKRGVMRVVSDLLYSTRTHRDAITACMDLCVLVAQLTGQVDKVIVQTLCDYYLHKREAWHVLAHLRASNAVPYHQDLLKKSISMMFYDKSTTSHDLLRMAGAANALRSLNASSTRARTLILNAAGRSRLISYNRTLRLSLYTCKVRGWNRLQSVVSSNLLRLLSDDVAKEALSAIVDAEKRGRKSKEAAEESTEDSADSPTDQHALYQQAQHVDACRAAAAVGELPMTPSELFDARFVGTVLPFLSHRSDRKRDLNTHSAGILTTISPYLSDKDVADVVDVIEELYLDDDAGAAAADDTNAAAATATAAPSKAIAVMPEHAQQLTDLLCELGGRSKDAAELLSALAGHNFNDWCLPILSSISTTITNAQQQQQQQGEGEEEKKSSNTTKFVSDLEAMSVFVPIVLRAIDEGDEVALETAFAACKTFCANDARCKLLANANETYPILCGIISQQKQLADEDEEDSREKSPSRALVTAGLHVLQLVAKCTAQCTGEVLSRVVDLIPVFGTRTSAELNAILRTTKSLAASTQTDAEEVKKTFHATINLQGLHKVCSGESCRVVDSIFEALGEQPPAKKEPSKEKKAKEDKATGAAAPSASGGGGKKGNECDVMEFDENTDNAFQFLVAKKSNSKKKEKHGEDGAQAAGQQQQQQQQSQSKDEGGVKGSKDKAPKNLPGFTLFAAKPNKKDTAKKAADAKKEYVRRTDDDYASATAARQQQRKQQRQKQKADQEKQRREEQQQQRQEQQQQRAGGRNANARKGGNERDDDSYHNDRRGGGGARRDDNNSYGRDDNSNRYSRRNDDYREDDHYGRGGGGKRQADQHGNSYAHQQQQQQHPKPETRVEGGYKRTVDHQQGVVIRERTQVGASKDRQSSSSSAQQQQQQQKGGKQQQSQGHKDPSLISMRSRDRTGGLDLTQLQGQIERRYNPNQPQSQQQPHHEQPQQQQTQQPQQQTQQQQHTRGGRGANANANAASASQQQQQQQQRGTNPKAPGATSWVKIAKSAEERESEERRRLEDYQRELDAQVADADRRKRGGGKHQQQQPQGPGSVEQQQPSQSPKPPEAVDSVFAQLYRMLPSDSRLQAKSASQLEIERERSAIEQRAERERQLRDRERQQEELRRVDEARREFAERQRREEEERQRYIAFQEQQERQQQFERQQEQERLMQQERRAQLERLQQLQRMGAAQGAGGAAGGAGGSNPFGAGAAAAGGFPTGLGGMQQFQASQQPQTQTQQQGQPLQQQQPGLAAAQYQRPGQQAQPGALGWPQPYGAPAAQHQHQQAPHAMPPPSGVSNPYASPQASTAATQMLQQQQLMQQQQRYYQQQAQYNQQQFRSVLSQGGGMQQGQQQQQQPQQQPKY